MPSLDVKAGSRRLRGESGLRLHGMISVSVRSWMPIVLYKPEIERQEPPSQQPCLLPPPPFPPRASANGACLEERVCSLLRRRGVLQQCRGLVFARRIRCQQQSATNSTVFSASAKRMNYTRISVHGQNSRITVAASTGRSVWNSHTLKWRTATARR